MDLVTPLYGVLFVLVILMVAGLACDVLSTLVMRLLRLVFGEGVYRVWSLVFLPGVMMHELAHATLLFLTGAEVDEIVILEDTSRPIVLYRRRGYLPSAQGTGRTAGHVAFVWRGPFVLESLQRVLGSVAPTVVGVTAMVLVFRMMVGPSSVCVYWWQYTVCVYFLLCALMGSALSVTDLSVMGPGLPLCAALLDVIFAATGFDVTTLVPLPVVASGPAMRRPW